MSPDPRPPIPMPPSVPLVAPGGFADRLAALGVTLDEAILARIGDYLARLLAMNELMNLTATKDPAEAWERHALDALSLLPHLAPIAPNGRLVDVGSGGGVPGIPLAIARPDLRVTLVEATQKKAAFLAAVAAALGLSNVSVVAERAEHLARGELRASFDVVTARAVARLSVLVPLVSPLARPGGLILLIKGQRAEEELTEADWVLRKQRIIHEQTADTPTGKIVVLRR